MNKKNALEHKTAAGNSGSTVVARLLTPKEFELVAGGTYAEHSQTPGPPYTMHVMSITGGGGNYTKTYEQRYEQIVREIQS